MEQKIQHYGLWLLGYSQRLVDDAAELDRQGNHTTASKLLAAAQDINGAIARLGEAMLNLQGKEIE